jgi:hypothetical protein
LLKWNAVTDGGKCYYRVTASARVLFVIWIRRFEVDTRTSETTKSFSLRVMAGYKKTYHNLNENIREEMRIRNITRMITKVKVIAIHHYQAKDTGYWCIWI